MDSCLYSYVFDFFWIYFFFFIKYSWFVKFGIIKGKRNNRLLWNVSKFGYVSIWCV